MSYQELKELAASTEPIPPELQMSREAFVQLVEQLDLVRASTAKYQDLNVAIRDGYELGSFNHYIHPGRLSDGVFKLTEPENLLYKVDDDTGEAELFGVAFLLPLREVGTGHPEGFVGPLDNWHVHYNTCGRMDPPFAEPERCRQLGGHPLHGWGWMIHAWVWKDHPAGVFDATMAPGYSKRDGLHHH